MSLESIGEELTVSDVGDAPERQHLRQKIGRRVLERQQRWRRPDAEGFSFMRSVPPVRRKSSPLHLVVRIPERRPLRCRPLARNVQAASRRRSHRR